MGKGRTTRVHRSIANVSLGLISVMIYLITGRLESLVTVVLPAAVVHWAISNERQLEDASSVIPIVPWSTKIALFVVPCALSLGIIVFWFPSYAKNWNPWGV